MIKLTDILLDEKFSLKGAYKKTKDFFTAATKQDADEFRANRTAAALKKRGTTWKIKSGRFGATNKHGSTRYFDSQESAQKFSQGPAPKAPKKAPAGSRRAKDPSKPGWGTPEKSDAELRDRLTAAINRK